MLTIWEGRARVDLKQEKSLMDDELCICGRGKILRDEATGISVYRVWLEGSSFGCQEYGASCKRCEDEQRERLRLEEEGY